MLSKLDPDAFERFHREVKGDTPVIWQTCFECGGKCEYNKVGTLLPGEKEYMASKKNMTPEAYADSFLDTLVVDRTELDVLRFVEPCCFLNCNFQCTVKEFKPVMCEIYPVVFETEGKNAKLFLDPECPITQQNGELASYFRFSVIPAFRKMGVTLEWMKLVEKYDYLNFDYAKIQSERKNPLRRMKYYLDDLITKGYVSQRERLPGEIQQEQTRTLGLSVHRK